MSRHNRASVVSERESKVGAVLVRGEGGAGCDTGPDGAVIASVTYEMGRGIAQEKKIGYFIIMIAAFVLNYCFHVSVVYIILMCVALGVLQTWLRRGGKK